MKYILVFCLFFISTNAASQAHKVYHRTFTKQNGLELDVIRAMMFDDDGFLWLGGSIFDLREIILSNKPLSLQRFNGTSFHSIPIPKTEGRAISVLNFYKRSDGLFYVQVATETRPELLLFDPGSMEFEILELPRRPDSPNSISFITHYDGKDYILLQHDRTMSMNILNHDLSFTPLFNFTSEENKFLLDPSSRILVYPDYFVIGDDNFPITVIDHDGNILKRYSGDSFTRNRDSEITKFWMDEVFTRKDTNYVFMRSNSQLHYWDKKTMSVVPVNSSKSKVPYKGLDVTSDTHGNHLVTISREEGLGFFELTQKGFREVHWIKGFDDPMAIKTISQNLKNDIWLASSKGELHYFRFPSTKVKTFLDNSALRAIAPLNDSTYLAATETEGWFKINPDTGEISPYPLTEKGKSFAPNSARNLIIEGDTIWSNHGGNILKINIENGESEAFRHYPVICMEKPNDSTIVYGTRGYHLMAFNTRSKEHKSLVLTDTLDIYDIETRESSALVVAGTDKGLLTYDLGTGESKFYDGETYLKDPFLLMLDYHPDYGYLLGSRSGQITAFDPEKEEFTIIYEDDLKAGIATLLFDNESWWINTFNGVVLFNPKDKTTTRFSVKDGLSDNEANRYSALRTQRGFFVGTINGLNYFDPKELRPEKMNSELVALKIRRYDSKSGAITDVLNRTEFVGGQTITLPAEHKELQIDFGLTQNVGNREHSYRYRLDSEPWTEMKQESSIRFVNMAPGSYKLEVEARDFSGKKIGNSLLFQIDSKNFFYKTWWFYLLLSVVLISLLLYMLYQALSRRKLHEKFSEELLLSQENERTRIAKELHDSVGQQLTLIKRKAQNLDQAEISKMTNDALEEVRDISRGLYPSNLKLLGLSESIEQLIYDWDEETDLFFSSEIDNIDSCFEEVETLNFYRFIQECVTNALKHSEATSVSVLICKKKQSIEAEISDNGKGFDAGDKMLQNSLGLKTMVERIRILKGTLRIQSSRDNGTSILTEIPIK